MEVRPKRIKALFIKCPKNQPDKLHWHFDGFGAARAIKGKPMGKNCQCIDQLQTVPDRLLRKRRWAQDGPSQQSFRSFLKY